MPDVMGRAVLGAPHLADHQTSGALAVLPQVRAQADATGPRNLARMNGWRASKIAVTEA
jgi:hypothetical protein